MRTLLFLSLVLLFFISCNTQEKPVKINNKPATTDTISDLNKQVRTANSWTPVDVSPMDMTYYPIDYPKSKNDSIARMPLARVIYSRPHLQGRKLFAGILKYGEPWRLGANEATEIEFYKPVNIQGKIINAGRYTLYCIPSIDNWMIVLNSNIDSWGLHPDSLKDIEKFTIPVHTTSDRLEFFTMLFRDNNGIAELYMAWDNLEAALPISFR